MKVCFLDRDGIINVDTGYINRPDDVEIFENVIKNLQILRDLGYFFIIVTNQSGIARGLISVRQYKAVATYIEKYLSQKSVPILDTFVCPHHIDGIVAEYSIHCECRKPKPGLIYSARDKYNLDLHECIIIGDSDRDVQAGIAAGVGHCFLVNNTRMKQSQLKSNYIASSLEDVVAAIINLKDEEVKC